MIDDKQLEQLPALARQIIKNGRDLADCKRAEVPSIERARNLRAEKRRLAGLAHKAWGNEAEGKR